jgi:hypothetical protein
VTGQQGLHRASLKMFPIEVKHSYLFHPVGD